MIIRIDYDDPGKDAPSEAVAASYRGVVAFHESRPNVRWYTGDPVVDWHDCIATCVVSGIRPVMLSSTCDHFIADCRGIFGWDDDPELGDVIVRHSPEEAMAISARLDQEEAAFEEKYG